MKVPFTPSYYRSRARARLRNSMRGYRILEGSGRLEFSIKLKHEISNTLLTSVNGRVLPLFFGAGAEYAEIILRQYLVTRVLSYDFNKRVLEAFGSGSMKVLQPLPPAWRKVVEKHGLTANTTWNTILWNWQVLLFFLFGLTVFVQMLVNNIKQWVNPFFPKKNKPYAYFEGLTLKNLPQLSTDHTSYDIFSWYALWKGKPKEIESLYHSIPGAQPTSANGLAVHGMPAAVAPSASFSDIIKYVWWGIRAFFVAVFDLLRGRFWHALLFGEAAKAAQVRLLTREKLAHDYLFPNSHWIYRPLWTYDAEKKGSRIIFYFYSTNVERLKDPEGYGLQAHTWQILNWPHYLVWDEGQADFVRRAVGDQKKIEIVGSIWFLPGNAEILSVPENSIAVFDINPLRDARYHWFIESPKYLVPSVINQFLIDIEKVAKANDLTMVLKRKRDIGNLLHKKNKRVVETLERSDHFLSVNMDIPAHRLIRECKIIISLPFTSTALIARELGKPSCFYDPSGRIQKDDRAAHGIPVINGPEELAVWVASVLHPMSVEHANGMLQENKTS